jgi:hypothetical protein
MNNQNASTLKSFFFVFFKTFLIIQNPKKNKASALMKYEKIVIETFKLCEHCEIY